MDLPPILYLIAGPCSEIYSLYLSGIHVYIYKFLVVNLFVQVHVMYLISNARLVLWHFLSSMKNFLNKSCKKMPWCVKDLSSFSTLKPKPFESRIWNSTRKYLDNYLVQLIEHPILRIPNFTFPNLRCCKVVFSF